MHVLPFVRYTAAGAALALLVSGCQSDTAKIEKARREIALQAETLMAKGEVPKDTARFRELTQVAGSAADPWGRTYLFERSSTRSFTIGSPGPDGVPGNGDDLREEFTFPSGSGLEDLKVVRADGVEAIKSPEGARTFWTTSRNLGSDQIVDYWIGDATANAEKPVRSETVDTDSFRRSVTLSRWSKDGKFLTFKDQDAGARPDSVSATTAVTIDASTGKVVDAATLPADLEWLDY